MHLQAMYKTSEARRNSQGITETIHRAIVFDSSEGCNADLNTSFLF